MVSWTCKVTWPAILAVLSTSKILWTPSLLLPWAPVYPVTARGCRAPLFAWKTRMDNLIKISVKCASFRSQREMDNFYLFYVYIFLFFSHLRRIPHLRYFHCLHRSLHSCHWWRCRSSWLLYLPQGFCQCYRLCCPWHLCAR